MPRTKDCLKEYGIYPEPFRDFEKSLKKSFRKRKDLFSRTRIREKTGKHPELIKKYLPAMLELHKVRKCEAYYLGCPPDELIKVNFGFGDIMFCPSCNTEILLPSDGDELICDCGIHYIKRDMF